MHDNNFGYWEDFGLGNTICIILILLFNAYFAVYEVRQMLYHKIHYFISFWNLVDLGSLLLNTTIVICDMAALDEEELNAMMSWAVLLMWLKLFYFGRMFETTAGMIRMVLEITFDMKYFLLIFMLAVAGFGN